jgi:hypothetical protein
MCLSLESSIKKSYDGYTVLPVIFASGLPNLVILSCHARCGFTWGSNNLTLQIPGLKKNVSDSGQGCRAALGFNEACWFDSASWRALGGRAVGARTLGCFLFDFYYHVNIVRGALVRRARHNRVAVYPRALKPEQRHHFLHGGSLPPGYSWQGT